MSNTLETHDVDVALERVESIVAILDVLLRTDKATREMAALRDGLVDIARVTIRPYLPTTKEPV